MSSIVNYVADGSTTEFQIPFTYISEAHVVVTIDGTATSAFTFLNSSTLQMTTAPTAGSKLQIQRTTPVGALVDFTDGSTLFETDLDLAHQQNRLIAEESKDIANVAKTTIDNNIADVNTVAAIAADVTNVASRGADVTSVADNMAEVLLADTNAATATTKAAEASTSESNALSYKDTALAASAASETARAASVVAKDASQVARTGSEAARDAAAASETAAATSETNAATSETNAAASEGVATTQAGISTTKAGEAATSASNAASSASSAQASKDAALAALDSFDDRYLGQKTADPTLDNDGDALVSGALYFNTTDDIMKVYEGSLWVAAYASLSGALLATNNLSDLSNAATARTNLGLGTAATSAATDFVAVTGDSMTGNLSFGDYTSAVFGNSYDLQIYHDGGDSYVKESGTGHLILQGAAQVKIQSSATGADMIRANSGADVALYHNNALKLATTSSGINVTGTVTATSFSGGTFTGNVSLGNNAITDVQNITVDDRITSTGDTDTYTQFHAGDQWRVVTGGTERLEVNNTDITMSVNLQMNDNYLDMNNNDIYGVDQIFHEGDTDTYMQFHAADQWRVVTGGAERLEVNNTQITSAEPIHAPSFHGDGSALTGIAAGAGGGGSDEIFWENGQNVTTNYTITNGKNAMSAGPITINSGVTVTVGAGETWTVI